MNKHVTQFIDVPEAFTAGVKDLFAEAKRQAKDRSVEPGVIVAYLRKDWDDKIVSIEFGIVEEVRAYFNLEDHTCYARVSVASSIRSGGGVGVATQVPLEHVFPVEQLEQAKELFAKIGDHEGPDIMVAEVGL